MRLQKFLGALGLAVTCVLANPLSPLPGCWANGMDVPLKAPDSTGQVATYRPDGAALGNLFYQKFGTNGRNCNTCHRESDGWSITPVQVQARFDVSEGRDPLFRLVDGATCPTDVVSSLASKRTAYALLLNRALIRMPFQFPDAAEFSVTDWTDPYRCTNLGTPTSGVISVYRRPLPTTNLPFQTSIMWDGRESDLQTQALNAAFQHEEATTPLTPDQLDQIVNFETGNYTAQVFDNSAGSLSAHRATGGPLALSEQQFFTGINDPFDNNPTDRPFDPDVFVLYQPWQQRQVFSTPAQLAVVRGEQLFDEHLITIIGVPGMNDEPGHNVVSGTCSFCHDTPGVGSHSVNALFNTGVAELGTRGLPLFTLACNSGPLAGSEFKVTDPGRALITGKCADIGKFKVPALRALAARPPYFHDGSAKTLMDVVNFYDNRFNMGLTPEQKRDLVAFLETL
jgi:cytochrome c peroxidase